MSAPAAPEKIARQVQTRAVADRLPPFSCYLFATLDTETYNNGAKSEITAGYSGENASFQACNMLIKANIREGGITPQGAGG